MPSKGSQDIKTLYKEWVAAMAARRCQLLEARSHVHAGLIAGGRVIHLTAYPNVSV